MCKGWAKRMNRLVKNGPPFPVSSDGICAKATPIFRTFPLDVRWCTLMYFDVSPNKRKLCVGFVNRLRAIEGLRYRLQPVNIRIGFDPLRGKDWSPNGTSKIFTRRTGAEL
jgi:hypothetical protein